MRKFRGMRIDNREYVYGDVFNAVDDDGRIITYIRQYSKDKTGFKDYLVIPSLVDQFIGIKDKNKKDIYEGDIINFRPYGEPSKHDEKIIIDDLFEFLEKKGYEEAELMQEYLPQNLEIIGNIFENPELLNKKELL